MVISELIAKLEEQKDKHGDCDVELISITSTSFNSSDPNIPTEKPIEQQDKIKIILKEDDTEGINITAYKSILWN
tara:strand:+ start:306 stop:530 length:225 start_codon:yes stop_codon:yes gene_type:complete